MKRGQVTTFIIISIVIIIIAILLTFLNKESVSNLLESNRLTRVPQEISAINHELKQCINDITASGIALLGQRGGTIYKEGQKINILYNKGITLMPTREEIKQHLTKYINDNIYKCNTEQYNISNKELTINMKNNIMVKVLFNFTIQKDDINYKPDDIIEIYNIDYDKILSTTEEIIKNSITNKSICLTCLNEISYKDNINTTIEYTNQTNFIIYSNYNDMVVGNRPYTFVFGGEL